MEEFANRFLLSGIAASCWLLIWATYESINEKTLGTARKYTNGAQKKPKKKVPGNWDIDSAAEQQTIDACEADMSQEMKTMYQ